MSQVTGSSPRVFRNRFETSRRNRQNVNENRSTSWIGTMNNYTDEDEARLQNYNCKYLVYGREIAPTTGTRHLQIYIVFNSQKERSTLCRAFPRTHWEAKSQYSSPSDCIAYMKKDGDFFEKGTPPVDAAVARQRGGEATKHKWEEIVANSKKGDFHLVDPEIVMKFYSTMKALRKDYMQSPPALEAGTEVAYWFYGSAGSGKSQYVRDHFPQVFDKSANTKWFCGYQNHETLLIDDFDLRHANHVFDLKRWGDRYPFPAETKNGSLIIRPKHVVVTSNYHPNQIWTSQADLEPILRRFRIVKFTKVNGVFTQHDEGRTDHGTPLPCVPWFSLPNVLMPPPPVIPDAIPHRELDDTAQELEDNLDDSLMNILFTT